LIAQRVKKGKGRESLIRGDKDRARKNELAGETAETTLRGKEKDSPY